jgi:ribosomal protein S18 acetylase RimI-like enzyme
MAGTSKEAGEAVVVREATVADAPAISAIGSVAFPAVHNDIAGEAFSAAVVEQTYSIGALTECICRCARADDAVFFVAERDGAVVGYLHYDCVGPEPELHRIYVDPEQKRGGIGSVLMREFHAWLDPENSYILLVAEANADALAFYERHGLVVESRVDGIEYYADAMSIEVDQPPPEAAALLLRFTKER